MQKLRVIRKVDVISVALVYAGILAALGLFIALIVVVFGSAFNALIPNSSAGGMGMMSMGIVGVIVFPLLYAFLGFIFGLIFGAVFNLIAPMVGGLKVFVDETL